MSKLKKKSSSWRSGFDLAKKRKRLREFEKETRKPDFWEDREEAVKVEKEISKLRKETEVFGALNKELAEIKDFLELIKKDRSLTRELEEKIQALEKRLKEVSLETFLSGPHDKRGAILQIFAGVGGRDAQDWATMLLRMYQRYCERKGFKVKILEQSFGEAGGPEGRIGTKSATLEISGKFTFGFLKREAGVHRLVRISPFSPQELRHTSFAQVVVLPKFKSHQEVQIDIGERNLRIETFRASGPGGQYMQKTETAVRITHLPTKITARCQSERSQAQNKKKAIQILCAKLYQLQREKQERDLKKIRGKIEPMWGKQVRNYVLYPYKLVKDLRTKVEIVDVEGVLDGDLNKFVEAEIRIANIR